MSKKISQLPTAGALTGSELVEAVQAGINVQTTTQDIADLGGGAVDSVNGQTGVVVLDQNDITAVNRPVTGTGAVTQDDANALIKFNSASPFNFTIDQLTSGSIVSYVNYGAGAVTLVAGSGVTITGRTVVPGAVGSDFAGGLIVWDSATAVHTVTGEEKEPDVATASTASGTITFDLANKYQRMFIGSASFATPKTIALSNDSNGRVIPFKLEITDLAAVLTFPSSFTMFDSRWNDTAHTLTFDVIGKYEFSATNYGDSEWILKVYGPVP